MTVRIEKGTAMGKITAPPSKSIAHRALICGALTEKSLIENIEYSEDILATLDCLEKLGARVQRNESSVIIGGFDPYNIPDNTEIYCRESGSTLRFLIPLCLLCERKITLKGAKRLFERPLGVYEKIFRENEIFYQKGEDFITLKGNLKRNSFRVRGDISSQFITGLMFYLSLLGGSIEIEGICESKSYINLTADTLNAFGAKAQLEENIIKIQKSSLNSLEFTVEGDESNAAFMDALRLLGGDVAVEGLNPATHQGDAAYHRMFAELKKGKGRFDLSDCPDLAPVMFALAAALGGARFSGTKRLKIKESDRAEAMKTELLKLGIAVEISENYVEIKDGTLKAPKEMLCGHNDHRIVMALAVLCTAVGGTIEGAEAVSKSYPRFFGDLERLGVKIYEN